LHSIYIENNPPYYQNVSFKLAQYINQEFEKMNHTNGDLFELKSYKFMEKKLAI
jgi:hypothetical protein